MAQALHRDRQLIRQVVPVVIGAILGGLLTGVPTVWVAISQQNLQLELAKRAEREQRRQRKVDALKSYLNSCSNISLASDHLVLTLEAGNKITLDAVRELQKEVNRFALSLTEVSAEFEMIGLAPLEELTALTAAFERSSDISPQAIRAMVEKVRPMLVALDRACRNASNSLLKFLLNDKRN
jgi:DNA polymerase III delta prime subunit